MKIEGRSGGEIEVPPCIGVTHVPGQALKHMLQKGLRFNLLAVGEKGTGVRTLIASIYNLSTAPPKKAQISENLSLHTVTIKGNSVSVALTLYIYRGRSAAELSAFFNEKNAQYSRSTSSLRRDRSEDQRISCTLFLISPLSFRKEDVEILEVLSRNSSTLTVIPKRDIFTTEELAAYREEIAAEVRSNPNISLYATQKVSLPLSTVASTTYIPADGTQRRGREYFWGSINAEDPTLSDLKLLTSLLLTHSFTELKKRTDFYYEQWKQEADPEPALGRVPDAQDKELIKEVQSAIRRKLADRIHALEQEEKELDAELRALEASGSLPAQ